MSWLRVDDKFAFHSKVVALASKNDPITVLIRAGAWSSGEGTDGFIPEHMALTIGSKGAWAKLIVGRLAEPADGGYSIHDYLQWNPSRAEVEQARTSRQRAGVASGEARRSNATRTHVRTHVQTDAQQTTNNIPSHPIPSTERSDHDPANAPGPKAKRGAQLPVDWAPAPALLEQCTQLAGEDSTTLVAQFADHHRSRGSVMKDWDAAFRTWARNHRRFQRRSSTPIGQQPDPSGRRFWKRAEDA